MTEHQEYLIKRATELEEIAKNVQSKIKSIYERTGHIQAQDVVMVIELHNRAMGMLEAVERPIDG